MNVFDKSLFALDDYLAKTSQDEIQKVMDEVNAMDFEGLSVEDFFNVIIKISQSDINSSKE